MYLRSIADFRALAILFVVAGHTYQEVGLDPAAPQNAFLANFVTGWTTPFVFISGYMFHHVFLRRFDYGRFLRSKVQNVLVPYTLLAAAVIPYFVSRNAHFAEEALAGALWPVGFHPFTDALGLYVYGTFLVAQWFVPFILLLFLMAPLHARFANVSGRVQFTIVGVLMLVALFAHRPLDNDNPVHAVIYFTPIYLLGMVASRYRPHFLALVRGRETLFIVLALTATGVQTLAGQSGNAHKALFTFAGPDLMLISKVLMTLAILGVMERLPDHGWRPAHWVAETSFATFMLHPVAIIYLHKFGLTQPTGMPWIDLIWVTGVTVACCTTIALMARTTLGSRSRLVVGY
ncbi:acyltransferase family protein [Notoacmeibacter ruber]|nr:acyltransferase [Notoacmeibacter ruber]